MLSLPLFEEFCETFFQLALNVGLADNCAHYAAKAGACNPDVGDSVT